MEFTATRNDIFDPLNHIIGAINRKSGVALLDNVLLTLGDNVLNLKATDNEIEMSISTPVQTDQPGTATVPARKLLDICKNLGINADVKFRVDENNALVRSGRSRFKLSTLPAGDFPIVDVQSDDSHQILLNAGDFLECLKMTASAMSKQDVRFYLVGILLEVNSAAITCVATDGHRLSKMTTNLIQRPVRPFKVIIPRKAVLELKSLLASVKPEEPVKLLASDNNIDVTVAGMCLKSKLIDGRYPDYQRVIPTDNNKTLVLNREMFKSSLTRASILANEKYRGVSLSLSKGVLTLSSNNPDQEESVDEIDVEYVGESLNVGFNVNYMLDAIAAFDSEDVCISLKDGNTSALISSDGSECLCVVMPMRL